MEHVSNIMAGMVEKYRKDGDPIGEATKGIMERVSDISWLPVPVSARYARIDDLRIVDTADLGYFIGTLFKAVKKSLRLQEGTFAGVIDLMNRKAMPSGAYPKNDWKAETPSAKQGEKIGGLALHFPPESREYEYLISVAEAIQAFHAAKPVVGGKEITKGRASEIIDRAMASLKKRRAS